jgi:hypothetical protein
MLGVVHLHQQPAVARFRQDLLRDGQPDQIVGGDAMLDNAESTIPSVSSLARLSNLNGDTTVDICNRALIVHAVNPAACGADDSGVLNHDRRITVLHARKLVLLCTRLSIKAMGLDAVHPTSATAALLTTRSAGPIAFAVARTRAMRGGA